MEKRKKIHNLIQQQSDLEKSKAGFLNFSFGENRQGGGMNKVGRPKKRKNPFIILKIEYNEDGGLEEEIIELKPLRKRAILVGEEGSIKKKFRAGILGNLNEESE